MSGLSETKVFNQKDKIVEGWYWALPSKKLKSGKVVPFEFLGRELVLFRSQSGKVSALDAYCPHMGAHLAEGKVEGDGIRCMFHHWKFDSSGSCTDIPCQKSLAMSGRLKSYPIEEKYGLIWIYIGKKALYPVPFVPELRDQETDALLGSQFLKNCHPNVVMINAIDAQHFNSVHPKVKMIAGQLDLQPNAQNENNIEFRNITPVPTESWIGRLMGLFYNGPLTYWMSYWYGSTGSVTLGPDFLHFHIIFALRPTLDGKTEGQTILVTRKRKGGSGKLANLLILQITRVVGNYFAKGDTQIFRSIRFSLRNPIKADHAIIRFIQHVEEQNTVDLGAKS